MENSLEEGPGGGMGGPRDMRRERIVGGGAGEETGEGVGVRGIVGRERMKGGVVGGGGATGRGGVAGGGGATGSGGVAGGGGAMAGAGVDDPGEDGALTLDPALQNEVRLFFNCTLTQLTYYLDTM